jgi:S-methylmethionine-dependent homocysteine/selenocysteine methylase
MKELLNKYPFILMEAAIIEQLRRSGQVRLHDTLVHAPLIYDPAGKKVLTKLYTNYISLALEHKLPILVCTPTWRADHDRVLASDVSQSVNTDAVIYMKELRAAQKDATDLIKIGGMMGCKNDCYLPEQGLSVSAAQQFHTWQVEQLAQAGVDFLLAETLPNIQEALGIAKAMAATEIPYIISFVISRNGCVLDGSSLQEAINLIDSKTNRAPIGYMINCAHPSFLDPEKVPTETWARLIGYQANASALDHCDLEQADELKSDSVTDWGQLMLRLNEEYGMPILGGCCGTGMEHLRYLVENRKNR